MKTLLALTLGLFSLTATSQPAIEWQNTIGGNGGDHLYSIQQTTDGGYILVGWSDSGISGDKTEASQGFDYWVIKLNAAGDIAWQNTIGGSDYDYLYSIQQTADGGYILGGHSASGISGDKTEASQGGYDYWVIKLDTAGNIVWQNTIGGSDHEWLYSIRQTADGGYILGGDSRTGISGDKIEASQGGDDYWVIKLNAAGTIVWQNTIGGNGADHLYSIQQTADGGYILGGWSDSGISGDKTEASQGLGDYWVIRLDTAGNIVWQNTIGGSDHEWLYSIQQTAGGGYILGGWSESGISGDKTEASQGFRDYWVIKLNATGNIVWQNTIGGSSADDLYSIQQTADGGYILGGYSGSGISGDKTEVGQGGVDYWVIKLDTTGTIVWQNTVGGSDYDGLYSIRQTADGGYILGGESRSGISGDKTEASQGAISFDYWVVKLAPDSGTIPCNASLAGNDLICANDSTSFTATGGISYSWSGPGGFTANTASTGAINIAGIYTVTVIDSLGDTSSCSRTLAVHPLCDDGDACTLDNCSALTGCTTIQIICDDGNACTGLESCDTVNGCVSGIPLGCDDSDLCTTDSCSALTGCIFNQITCDDSNVCTADSCLSGNCAFTPITCDDGDVCTSDSCQNGLCINDTLPGCNNPCDTLICFDGDLCTIDTCANGTCTFTSIACDDSDPCTIDSCVSGSCAFTPITCDDNDLCATDSCVNGTCISTPITCNDNDLCSNDSCVNGICVFSPITCDDNDLCATDSCVNGTCISTPITCDDNDLCSNDSCVNGICVFTPITCDDSNPCTIDNCVPIINLPSNSFFDSTTLHLYQRVDSVISWSNANTTAQNTFFQGVQGHLATPTTRYEDSLLFTNLTPVNNFWIGGYQDTLDPSYSEPDGGWKWITGELWSYTGRDWGSGQPDNNSVFNENHLAYRGGESWNDFYDNYLAEALGYIIEYDLSGIIGSCSHTPINCDDQNSCTTDTCIQGICQNNLIINCDDNVWPGDANSDGIANVWDVLAIGIGYGNSGPARVNATTNWIGQTALDWQLQFLSGVNLKHADCDGSALIDSNDVQVISLNYGRTHAKTGSPQRAIDPDFFLEFPKDSFQTGDTVTGTIHLGTQTAPVSDIYGIAFSLLYDQNIIDSNGIAVSFTNSWVAPTSRVSLAKDLYAASRVDVGLSRTDHNNISGYGIIGNVSFVIQDNIDGKDYFVLPLEIQFDEVVAIDKDEASVNVTANGDTLYITGETTGIESIIQQYNVRIFPNPATNTINIVTDCALTEYSLMDLTGREIIHKRVDANERLSVDVSTLETGSYFINLRSSDHYSICRKIVVFR